MTTLAQDAPRNFMLGDIEEYPVIAGDIIYMGAAVGENGSGYARPLQAGDPFLGFAEVRADNADGAAGDRTVRVYRRGRMRLEVAGANAITANDGAPVYAADDDTFTLTANSNSLIGVVSRWISGTTCIVEFDAFPALTVTGTFTGSTTSPADSLAIPVTHRVVAKTTGGDGEACTLANGTSGQRLTVHLATDGGGNATITPATKSGFANVVLADTGDHVTFEYVDDTVGWVIIGTAGVSGEPVIALS